MARPLTRRDPFRPVEAGWEVPISRWLIPGYLLGVAVPSLVAVWVNLRMPPGPIDPALDKWRQLTDDFALGMAFFDTLAVFTVAIGCLIVTLMKARPRYADSMPGPED